MNILNKIKNRKKIPGTLCCPICNPLGNKLQYEKWWHHHNAMDVIQQIFSRFTTASAKDIAEEICNYELYKPNLEYSKKITKMNMECTYKLILKYGGTEGEWKLIEKEVKNILNNLKSTKQVENAVKLIEKILNGFSYKQKEHIMYKVLK